MNNTTHLLPTTRREFLKLSASGAGLLAFSSFAPSFLVKSLRAAGAPAPERDRGILVLVHLAGGNDGLTTPVPFADAQYYKLRPTLAIPEDKVLRLTDTLGLHPACPELAALYKDGKLGVVQNVGYPNPNHSHFRSSEIWETATDSDRFSDTGWIGRFMDNTCHGSPALDAAATAATSEPDALHLTNETPQTFFAARPHNTFGLNPSQSGRRDARQNLEFLETLIKMPTASSGRRPAGYEHDNNTFLKQTMMDALMTEKNVQKVLGDYKPAPGVSYPQNSFAQSLRSVAGLIAANLPTRVYFVTLGSFDTHANEAGTHHSLLRTLSESMAAFQKDLDAHGLAGQVLTMTFSEFGRRPMENESKGTDHGTAAPLFVMGSKIKAGMHGAAPSLNLARNQDLTFSTDFRQVYATVLEHWFNCPSQPILNGADFKPLDFV
jgi:uncharacterized protein (DUF1501 family)